MALGYEGDMVERGLTPATAGVAAIVVAAVGLWFVLGQRIASKLTDVNNSF